MQPLGLNKKAAEKQNAQNYDYRNDDDLNQAHTIPQFVKGEQKH
jgi:hypothetical protein